MAEEFEFRDMSDAAFWGVELRRAMFRDVDLTGARITHARLVDVEIEAEIDRLIVNGVDVTAYVNERDEWIALRSVLDPTDLEAARRGWQVHRVAWERTIARAQTLPAERLHAAVDGEWSFVETLRHLVFATDKWFTVPILGGTFDPMGLPNSGSATFGWPGIDVLADPTFDDAVAAWRGRAERLRRHLDTVGPAALVLEVEVLENGPSPVLDCVGVVVEEHFHHLRYATRDLDRLG